MRRLLDWLRRLFRRREPDQERSRLVRLAEPGDRRAFPRMKLGLNVKLQFASMDEVVESRTVDISRGGVFLRMRQPRGEGTNVNLDIEVGGSPVTLSGVVVRTVRQDDGAGSAGIGVLLTDLGDEQQEFLERLLRAHEAHD